MDQEDSGERMELVRPAALPGTELMSVSNSSRTWHAFHERYAFTACVSGKAGMQYRRVRSDLAGPCTVVLEPGETHYDTYVAEPSCFHVFFVEPATLADCARELHASRSFHFSRHFPLRPGLFPVLNDLCMSIHRRESDLEQQSRFAQCILAFVTHAEEKPKEPLVRNSKRALEQARDYLRARYNEPVSLGDLERVSRLNRFHLVHAFTQHFGISPHAYQIYIRVERAGSMLRRKVSAKAAALTVGFADQSHFARHFKRIWRVTPGEYARLTTS